MILPDTNVVSETMRRSPDPAVVAWLDAQAAETLHLSAVSLAQLLFAIAAARGLVVATRDTGPFAADRLDRQEIHSDPFLSRE